MDCDISVSILTQAPSNLSKPWLMLGGSMYGYQYATGTIAAVTEPS